MKCQNKILKSVYSQFHKKESMLQALSPYSNHIRNPFQLHTPSTSSSTICLRLTTSPCTSASPTPQIAGWQPPHADCCAAPASTSETTASGCGCASPAAPRTMGIDSADTARGCPSPAEETRRSSRWGLMVAPPVAPPVQTRRKAGSAQVSPVPRSRHMVTPAADGRALSACCSFEAPRAIAAASSLTGQVPPWQGGLRLSRQT